MKTSLIATCVFLTAAFSPFAAQAGGATACVPPEPHVLDLGGGKLRPAEGYAWVCPAEADFRVVWSPGKPHSVYSRIVAAQQAGHWAPAPGYRFINDCPNNFSTAWTPGAPHACYAHVFAAPVEGHWCAEPGYRFANADAGDLSVVRAASPAPARVQADDSAANTVTSETAKVVLNVVVKASISALLEQ